MLSVSEKIKRRLSGNIWKYYLLKIFAKRMVWPILTLFLLRNQLSVTEIGIIFSVGTIIGLIAEVPSGAIADKIGRRAALSICFFGWALSMLIFWLSGGFWGFLVAQVVYSAAGSLWTGTNEAFIFETLNGLGRQKEIKKISGRALFFSQVITGVLFVAIPVIANFSLSLPFLLNVFVFLFGGLIALSVFEPPQVKSVAEVEVGKDFFGFRAFFTNPVLLSIGLLFGLMSGVSGILEDFRQVYLEFINFPLFLFGFVYLALRLLTGVFALKVEAIEKRIGSKALFLVAPLSLFVAYTGLAIFSSWWGLLFIVLDGFQDGLTRPLEQEYLNRFVKGEQRATMISVFNLIGSLLRAGFVLAGGFLIDYCGLSFTFALVAGFIFLTLPLCFKFLKIIKSA